jgi:hypothetical protein
MRPKAGRAWRTTPEALTAPQGILLRTSSSRPWRLGARPPTDDGDWHSTCAPKAFPFPLTLSAISSDDEEFIERPLGLHIEEDHLPTCFVMEVPPAK